MSIWPAIPTASGEPLISLSRLILLSVVLFLTLSCGQARGPDALRFGLVAMPVTLDPRFATDAASSRINRLLYQRLVNFDEQYRPVPALATWEVLTPRHYRFHLKEARFSNGEPVTARDVEATFAFIRDEKNASPHRMALNSIARMAVVDDHTIDFFLHEADPLFPGRLGMGILPAGLIASGHPFNRRPVGSGPFVLLGWEEGAGLRLRRRRDGQAFEFVKVQDPTVRVLKLLRGEIDMLQNDLPPELVNYLRRQDGIRVMKGTGSNYAYLGFNLRDAVAGDARVRRAIAHAIDREAIIRHVMGEAARPAIGLLPPDHWSSDPAVPQVAHDVQRARRLLKEAGYDEHHPVRLVYKTSSDPFRLRLATIIQHQLAEAGIEVTLKSYDWGTFYGDIKAGRFQMYSLMWVGIKLPDIYRYVFHSSAVPPAGANRGRFADPWVDALIERAEAGLSLGEQAQYYGRLQALIQQELPYVPLWYEDHVFVARAGIAGYRIARDGNYDGLAHVYRIEEEGRP